MSLLSRLFGGAAKDARKVVADAPPEEALVIVPIPPLVVMLQSLEQQKGAPLTEAEVLAARDDCACITMRPEHAAAMTEKRGYRDLDLENVWAEWLAFRAGQ